VSRTNHARKRRTTDTFLQLRIPKRLADALNAEAKISRKGWPWGPTVADVARTMLAKALRLEDVS
jgi:hypothetical protein